MIFSQLFKHKLSLATKTPFEAASGENQDYSMYNFVVKNRALQPFVPRLIATSLYPYKTRQHNRQIIQVIPVLLKFWTTVSSTLKVPVAMTN